MSSILVFSILIGLVSAQFYDFEQVPQQYYHPNSLQYEYMDNGAMYYALPQQQQVQNFQPYYQMMRPYPKMAYSNQVNPQQYYQMMRPYPKMSYSKQIMQACGCEHAKTYAEYLKYREYIKRQNRMMLNYYNMYRM